MALQASPAASRAGEIPLEPPEGALLGLDLLASRTPETFLLF